MSRLAVITDFIPTGRENRIPSKSLAAVMGYRTVRELQKTIEAERARGAVILSTCTDGGGYWLPDETERHEVKRFIGTLEARAEHTMAAVQSAKNFLYKQIISPPNCGTRACFVYGGMRYAPALISPLNARITPAQAAGL